MCVCGEQGRWEDILDKDHSLDRLCSEEEGSLRDCGVQGGGMLMRGGSSRQGPGLQVTARVLFFISNAVENYLRLGERHG